MAAALQKFIRLIVDQALDRLDHRCGYVLRSRYYEGKSSAEIAAALRMEPSNGDVILHRCRGRLRDIIGDDAS